MFLVNSSFHGFSLNLRISRLPTHENPPTPVTLIELLNLFGTVRKQTLEVPR